MEWTYKGKIIDSVDQMPNKTAGFIYIITDIETKRKYIGRKLVTRAHRRQKNKKIIRSRVESDWKDYWSSSPDLIQLIEDKGPEKFTREILLFAETKGQLNYLEERFLYTVGAMESEEWSNSNIRSKMYKRNILNKFDIEELTNTLEYIKNK